MSVAPRFSVVVPVYGNEQTLPAVISGLEKIAERLPGALEVVFVVDGSPDGSLGVLERLLPYASVAGQIVVHSRNWGSFPAIRTGLSAVRGEFIGVMAADLQEPPELMEQFFSALLFGQVDVVVGRRESRDDPAVSSLMSRMFWGSYRRVVNREIPPGGVDVFGCTAEVAKQLLELNESHSSLVGLLYWVGFRRLEVPYARAARNDGRKSGWSLRKRVGYLMDSVFSFTAIPITVLGVTGGIGLLVTVAVAVLVLVSRLTGRVTSLGYTPLMLVILFSMFMVLFALSVIGSYVWRAYENSKQRPVAIAASRQFFDADNHHCTVNVPRRTTNHQADRRPTARSGSHTTHT